MSKAAKKCGGAGVELVKFNFHGDELDVVPGDGVAHVSFRRVCEAIGVGFGSQLQKVKTNPAISVTMIVTQIPGDDQRREVVCVDLRSMPLWLATIHPSKVRPELREKLVRYQRECADVLADHFLGRRGEAPAGYLSPEQHAAALATLDERVAWLEKALADYTAAASGVIGPEDLTRLRHEIRYIGSLWAATGLAKSDPAGIMLVRHRVLDRWFGAGKSYDTIPRHMVGEVLAQLKVMRKDAERRLDSERRSRQTILKFKLPFAA